MIFFRICCWIRLKYSQMHMSIKIDINRPGFPSLSLWLLFMQESNQILFFSSTIKCHLSYLCKGLDWHLLVEIFYFSQGFITWAEKSGMNSSSSSVWRWKLNKQCKASVSVSLLLWWWKWIYIFLCKTSHRWKMILCVILFYSSIIHSHFYYNRKSEMRRKIIARNNLFPSIHQTIDYWIWLLKIVSRMRESRPSKMT